MEFTLQRIESYSELNAFLIFFTQYKNNTFKKNCSLKTVVYISVNADVVRHASEHTHNSANQN